jgi:hypothetical protein
MALSTCNPVWMEKVQQGYSKDNKAQKIISALLVAPGSVPHYTWTDGLLRYKNRIWIGNNAELQQPILQALHTSAIGGHSGLSETQTIVCLVGYEGFNSFICASLLDLSVSQTQQCQVSRSVGPIACARRSLAGDFDGFHRRTA